jgi:adenylate cyclase
MSIYEIERKFLLKNGSWKSLVFKVNEIEQSYLDLEKIKFYFKGSTFKIVSKLFKIKLKLKDVEVKALKENLYREKKVVRIRRMNNQYILTIKIDIDEVGKNIEVERFIAKEKYEFSKVIATKLIAKSRSLVNFNNYVFEIDEFKFKNKDKNLVLAEVEVGNISEPEVLPDWIGKEVTGDSAYFNSNLAE